MVRANDDTTLIETGGFFVELLSATCVHKYLGRAWSGDLRKRGQAAVDHRIACAWAKFRSLETSLVNRHVSIKLRLAMFDATVNATAAYGLETCPVTSKQLAKIDITQTKMLRKMVGWVHGSEESWEESRRRMKLRLETALHLFPIDRGPRS